MSRTAFIFAFVAALLSSQAVLAEPRGLPHFLVDQRPTTGQQYYLGRVRLPSIAAKALKHIKPLAKRIVSRKMVQVENQTLEQYVKDTSRGYLEVVVPKGKGHVFFRLGQEVYDFFPGGFRVGGVRPIKSERYGMLVPLSQEQEGRLAAYFQRLKQTEGKELGEYDFEGENGFHCVSWIMREALGADGKNLAQVLGKEDGHAGGMVSFSRFMLKKAQPVEAVVLYSDQPLNQRSLGKKKIKLMTSRQLERAYRDGTFH